MGRKCLFAVPLAFGLMLSGCGQSGRSGTDASGGTEQPAEPAGAPASAGQDARGILEIGGGSFVLPDGFRVRSKNKRGEAADGSRVARVEFRAAPDTAANTIRKAFADIGFHQASAIEESGVMTRIYRSQDGLRVRAVFVPKGPDLKVELLSADSSGLVTFYWRDAPSEG